MSIVNGGEVVAISLVSALAFVGGEAMAMVMVMQYRSSSWGERMGS
jgi:hypothetical protein